jgi:hypothetical protein
MKIKPYILSKPGFIIIITLIILLSFRLFSTIYYPLVNSDEGVTVLMLHYFKLPGDLYFWGQDRYGSIIPLLGQAPHQLFGLSSILSESITHYLLLIAGFLALSTFIRSKIYRLLFAVVWFLPPLHYADLLRNVFGLQYAATGILFFLLYRYQPSYQIKDISSKWPYCLLLLVVFIITCWISDLAITSVAAFLMVRTSFLFREEKLKDIFRKPETYFLVLGLILTYFIINYLKSLVEAGPYDKYSEQILNDFPSTIQSFTLLFTTIGSILSFSRPDYLFSIYSWLLIIIFLLVFLNRKKIVMDRREARWAMVFILDGLILLMVIQISAWALLNEMPRRYFVGAYISFWLAFLMIFSYFSPGRIKSVIAVLTMLAIGLGALSTVYSLKFIDPKSFKPKAELAGEFSRPGKTGIIADYWNSYANSFADPANIKATPYEHSYSVRNFKLVDSVFAQPKIYIIRDLWMDDFPDSMVQFDRTLIRKDSSFFMGGCIVNEYTVKRNWVFNIKDLKSLPELIVFDQSMDKDVLKIGHGYEACIYKYLVFGPFMTLLKGQYEADFNIRIDSVFTTNDIAELDVVSDYGNTKMASLTLKPSLIPSLKAVHEFKLEFNVEEKTSTVEFRIYYLGGAYLTFDRIKLRHVSE